MWGQEGWAEKVTRVQKKRNMQSKEKEKCGPQGVFANLTSKPILHAKSHLDSLQYYSNILPTMIPLIEHHALATLL